MIEMMLGPSPSNWLVRLLPIEGQVSLAMGHDGLAPRENFRALASLNEVSDIPKSIVEDSGRSSIKNTVKLLINF